MTNEVKQTTTPQLFYQLQQKHLREWCSTALHGFKIPHLILIVTSRKHGFLRGPTNFMVFQIDIFGEQKQVDAIQSSILQAFDRYVSHKILMRKLEDCGFAGGLLRWFSTYLRERQLQVICFNGVLSRDFPATCSSTQVLLSTRLNSGTSTV